MSPLVQQVVWRIGCFWWLLLSVSLLEYVSVSCCRMQLVAAGYVPPLSSVMCRRAAVRVSSADVPPLLHICTHVSQLHVHP